MASMCDENIGGFNIAMNDALIMGGLQRIRDLERNPDYLFDRHWPALH